MFIPFPRTNDEGDGCPSGHVYCTPSGPDSGGASTSTSMASTDSMANKAGLHRFIGITMVIVMALLVAAIWLYYLRAAKQRRKNIGGAAPLSSSSYFCFGRRKKQGTADPTMPGDTEAPSLLDMDGTPRMDAKTPVSPVAEKERSRVLEYEPRGLIKEVSGGMVMYTEPPRSAMLPGRDRYPAAVDSNWGFERVHGVRFEARSSPSSSSPSSPPPRHQSRNPSTPPGIIPGRSS